MRCMAFLNSLFFPGIDNKGFRIKKLKMLDTEWMGLGSINGKGTKRADLVCRCTCWSGIMKSKQEITQVKNLL